MPQITFPASLDQTPAAMEFLREHLTGDHESLLGFVELAVEELLVNVINYAYPEPKPGGESAAPPDRFGQVELGCRWVSMDDVPYLCVWIRDWGTPFDPFLEAPRPDISQDLEDRPIGGLGVHLVRNVSAHHCYSGSDGTNTIELYFRDRPES